MPGEDPVILTGGSRALGRKVMSSPTSFLDEFHPEPWMQDALCAQTDPEAFFPEKGGSTRDAKRVCNGVAGREDMPGCSVRDECLAYALREDQRFGIWGGHSERERRLLRRSLVVGAQVSDKGWTPAEDSILRRMVREKRSNTEIARTLLRKPSTIATRRRTLGLPATSHAFGAQPTTTTRKGA